MRILLIGGTGTIGHALRGALEARHDVIVATRKGEMEKVDLSSVVSIRELYDRVGTVDAVVSAAGSAAWKRLDQLVEQDFEFSLHDKLMGQVNVVRYALLDPKVVRDGGSVTVTSGYLAHHPMPGSAAVSLVNAGLEGFVRAAALEAKRGIRVNCVSPGWVSETLEKMGQSPKGGIPAADVAQSFVDVIEGRMNGMIVSAVKG